MRKNFRKSFQEHVFGRILFVLFFLGIGASQLMAEMAQKPLFLVGNVGPNILLIIDDSGSMQEESMPTISGYYSFRPHADTFRPGPIYNSNSYAGTSSFVPFDDTSLSSVRFRSPQMNTLYYNPAKTYTPWVKHDGSFYPAAPPHAAPHNPGNYYDYNRTDETPPGTYTNYYSSGSRATRDFTQDTLESVANDNSSSTAIQLGPAIYYYLRDGMSGWDTTHYDKIRIHSGVDRYDGHGREARSDCAGQAYGFCTYEEEIQNFANWYSYHRSRAATAKAGLGKAFRNVGDSVRVGYGSINSSSTVDGRASQAVRRGVRAFYGADKIEFYRYLYEAPISGGTPLRRALDAAGLYYSRKDNRGPWGNTPGQDDGTAIAEQISCRGCYTVLMSDGYYSTGSSDEAQTSAARSNNDNTTGTKYTSSTSGTTFRYSPVRPFTDSYSNTLADVAMYYWKTDLRPGEPEQDGLKNNVSVTAGIDPAFWQHMVTFTVGFGVTGTIDPENAFKAMKTSNANSLDAPTVHGSPSITWPNPGNSNAAKIDDLLHAAVNGRGNFLSANDPDALAEGMEAVLGEIAKRSAGSVSAIATNSTSASDSTLVFQASMDSFDWTGGITAYKVKADGTIGDLAWTTRNTGKIPAATSRKIYTWLPTVKQGTSFLWNNLTTEQKAMLNGATQNIESGRGQERLNWLRGDQSKEIKNGGVYRNRSLILGDIVNSDPALVNPGLTFGYDNLPDTSFGKTIYASFISGNSTHTPMLYVGSNDGMLHAFDARNDTNQGGKEIFAYVPNLVFEKLIELTDSSYEHRYYVNGSPAIGHAYINGEWKTILVGSLGAGGKGLFALDVTNPENFGPQNILWEMDEASFGTENWKDIGYMIGPPVLAHTKDGSWVVLVGNGYESENGKASLMIIDLKTGALLRKIEVDPKPGAAAKPNGLSAVTLLADDDRTISRVYAGDLHGQLWQFDLSGNSSASWGIGNSGAPVFTAKNFVDDDDRLMPITSPIAIRNHPGTTSSEHKGYLLYFGTGAYYDETAHTVLANNTANAFYCIWDRDEDNVSIDDYDYDSGFAGGGMNSGALLQQKILYEENAGVHKVSWCSVAPGVSTCPNNAEVVKVTSVLTDDPDVLSAHIASHETNTLKVLRTTQSDYDIRIVTDYSMNWYADDNPNGYRGWYLPLIPPSPRNDEGERVTAKAALRNDKVLFTTLVPSPEGWNDPCLPNASSWFMQLDAFSGSRTTGASFDMDKGGTLSDADMAKIKGGNYSVSGVRQGAGVMTLGSFLSVGNLQIALLSNSEGAGIETWGIGDTKLPESGRHSWREIFF